MVDETGTAICTDFGADVTYVAVCSRHFAAVSAGYKAVSLFL